MRKRRMGFLALTVGFGLAVAGRTGSGGTDAADPADLEGTWVLESFGGTTELTPADPEVTTELTLQDGEATGKGGVNRFNGTYEATDDGTFSFGPIASTKMAGSDEAMAQESQFFAALESAEHFEFNDGKLVLGDLGHNTLVVLAEK